MPARPCPRPGSRNRLTPWISAASSAAPSPQRSPKRLAWVLSSDRRNPMPRIAHRDHRDPAPQPAPEGVRLHRHPATGAGVLHNILARFRKRHTEPHRGVSLQPELAVQDARGALADLLDHLVHVLHRPDRRDVEQDVARSGRRRLGHPAVQLEQLRRVPEEADPGPVALDVVADGHGEKRALSLGLGNRLPRGEHADQAVGRGPLRSARVDQELLLRRPRAEARGELVEAAVVEMRRGLR